MNISKFNFLEFSKEKWQEILTEIEGDWHFVDIIAPRFETENGEFVLDKAGSLMPLVDMQYIYETQVDGDETYSYTFTAFEVKVADEIASIPTRVWRKIMYKEFGEEYYNALKEYLKAVKEVKKQKADEEYENDLNDLLSK